MRKFKLEGVVLLLAFLAIGLVVSSSSSAQYYPPGGGGSGGATGPTGPTGPTAAGGSVIAYTVDHALVSGDCGNLITFNGSSLTLTLANPPISSTCQTLVQNLGSSTLTIARNSLTINGASSNVTIAAASGVTAGTVTVWTNGTNYFVSAGSPGSAGATGATGATGPSGVGGGLNLIEEHTASTSATLDFTTCITSTYDEYIFTVANVIPATNNTNLLVRVSTNSGSTYDSGTNYGWDAASWRAGAGFTVGGAAGATSMSLTTANGLGVSNAATGGVVFRALHLFSPNSAALFKQFVGDGEMLYQDGTTRVMLSFGGEYSSATAVNAVRFLFSSGNIASGTIRCYGLSK